MSLPKHALCTFYPADMEANSAAADFFKNVDIAIKDINAQNLLMMKVKIQTNMSPDMDAGMPDVIW